MNRRKIKKKLARIMGLAQEVWAEVDRGPVDEPVVVPVPPKRRPRPDDRPDDEPEGSYPTPPTPDVSSEARGSIWAYPDKVEQHRKGERPKVLPGLAGLADAIRVSEPSEPIVPVGDLGDLTFGSGLYQSGEFADDIVIVGVAEHAHTIGSIIADHIDGDLSLFDTIQANNPNVFAPIWFRSYERVLGRLLCVRVTLGGEGTGWSGWPSKWQIKGTGYAENGVQVYDSNFRRTGGALEHNCYLDRLSGDNRFVRCNFGNTTRTGLQVNSRRWPNGQGNPGGPLEPNEGTLTVIDSDCRNISIAGGSALTVYGMGGPVLVDGWTVMPNDEGYGDGREFGAMVFGSSSWHGTHLNENGFACPKATIRNASCDMPNATRDLWMFSGVELVLFEQDAECALKGKRTAVSIQTQHGGGIPVGEFKFVGTGSMWTGWQADAKVKEDEVQLSDSQIDDMSVSRY